MQKILVIQTAFIGDVILATALLENLHADYPQSTIDLLVKKGNEMLFKNHPFINKVMVFDKSKNKINTLNTLLAEIRKEKYDLVINLHRFGSSGFLTAFSGARQKIGFAKNPFSFLFTKKISHVIGNGTHEVDRNYELIKHITRSKIRQPRLYPSPSDYSLVSQYKKRDYFCIAPASVWFTKQLPDKKWIELTDLLPPDKDIYLLGAPGDKELCDHIISQSKHPSVYSLCGKLNLLQSAALMQDAVMNYVNDSAPLHLASAMNARVTAFFCSTVPAFGFGPLSEKSVIAETEINLDCRPCGLHGFRKCPKGHFKCALTIEVKKFIP